MNTIKEKLEALRKVMDRENLDAYIVSGTDPHNSEYLAEAWQQRKWISGFTGSYGTVVVLKNTAGLWTDSRYFLQAEGELANTGIVLYKLKTPGVLDYPEWLAQQLNEKAVVGFDGFCTPVMEAQRIKEVLLSKGIELKEKIDLLGEVWQDRPILPENRLFIHEEKYAGKSAKEKIDSIRKFLIKNHADYILLSALDEIAWLYNIRGNDIPYNPLVISYAIVGMDMAWLFVKKSKVAKTTTLDLNKQGIEVVDYHHLFLHIGELSKENVFLVDKSTLNFTIYSKLLAKFQVKEYTSPIILEKAVKNPIEIEGEKQACIKDGVALIRFFCWLEHNITDHEITETEAADVLNSFRSECPDYISDSFNTISAYGANAALPHYSAVRDKDSVLQTKGLYLLDSGAQYSYGTTDVTRTIPMGDTTDLEREDYTLVLKGMITLSMCKFPRGTCGGNLDIVARYALWNKMQNYGHGTGHGVGCFLCVHEGPQGIRQDLKNQPFEPGMITSNEPGMYRNDMHGIRHENLLLCKSFGSNEFGDWLGFETLTLCYFDTSILKIDLLEKREIEWLNAYHQDVYEKLSPFLGSSEKEWLKHKTRPIA